MTLLIYFFGPDGSGKTTLARVLAKEFKVRGFKVKISWMRGTHTLASFLAKFLSNFNTFKGYDNPYYHISIPRSLKRFWQVIEFISVLPILLTKFLIPNTLNYIIVADRYIPDFLTWVLITTNDLRYLKHLEAKFLLMLSTKAGIGIYVTASELELLRRRSKDLGKEFLKKQLIVYEKLVKLLKTHKVDTTGKNISETLKQLMDLIPIKLKITY